MNRTASSAVTRYHPVSMTLHWVLALAILGAFVMGVVVDDMPLSPTRLKLINWHKWAGITILLLSAVRLLWRIICPPPPLPDSLSRAMSRTQHVIFHATHRMLYALFFVVPLAGWAYSSAKGFPIVWFGVLPLPDWMPVNKAWADTIKEFHGACAFALIGLVGLHVAAALKHQFVDKDGLLSRMWPGK